MFEAVLALCLAAGGPCRPVLLPGYEAGTRAGCAARLAENPPTLADRFPGATAEAPPECQKAGIALAFTEVAPGVFVHEGAIAEPDRGNQGDTANIGFVIGTRSVAVIDSGSARWMGAATWRAIRARTDLPVGHVILTHLHPDHVLGASVFAEAGAEIVAHAGLDRALADRRATYLDRFARLIGPGPFLGTSVVAVARGIEDTHRIDLGDRHLHLRAWPRAHSGTDLTVTDEATGILFAGDLVFDRHIPTLDGSLTGWQAVLHEMTAMELRGVVPGHGGPLLDWPAGAAPMHRYLDRLAADTRAALDRGERLGDATGRIAAAEAPHWALFDAYNGRNATVAFTELEWE